MSSQEPNPMFAELSAPSRKRWTYVGYAFAGQFVAVAILVQVGLIGPTIVPQRAVDNSITLEVPVPVPHQPQRIRPFLIRPPRRVLSQPAKLAMVPHVEAPKIAPEPTPMPKLEAKVEVQPRPMVSNHPVFASATVAKTMAKPGPAVKTGDFGGGSSATPTTTLAASRVQTGGFGDPNGVAAQKTSTGPANIAHVGAFDLPAGAGHGNGTGGEHGARGVVASAGFGNSVAAPGGGSYAGGVIKTAGFNESGPASAVRRSRVASEPASTAAEVLSKPTPVYTAEARALKLQGEVLLQVVFLASGKVEVLHVVRGLGHGLDEAAIHAAQQIKFKPATRGGAPVDSVATLHIVFQLA